MKKQAKTWHKVKAPKSWRPEPGEELIGTYVSTEARAGQFGEYKVHYIKTRNQTYYVSGAVVNDLFALLQPDIKIKLVFLGKKLTKDTGREYKHFELFTEEVIEIKLAEVG